jgi:hypothetical protein
MIVIKHRQYGEATFTGGEWTAQQDWWAKILNDTIPSDNDPRFNIADSFRRGGWEGICTREVQKTFGRDITILRYEPEKVPEVENAVY